MSSALGPMSLGAGGDTWQLINLNRSSPELMAFNFRTNGPSSFNFFNCNTVDLQCYVSFWCTASDSVIYSFSYSFPLWFITEY